MTLLLKAQTFMQHPNLGCGARLGRDTTVPLHPDWRIWGFAGVTALNEKRPNIKASQEYGLVATTQSAVRGFQRRGLRREDAAAYIGVSPSKFDDWVRRQLMPNPKRQDGVVVWDRFALDAAFEALGAEDAEDLSIWNDLKV